MHDNLIEYYSVDASTYSVRPAAVAFPETAREISDTIRRAIDTGTSVTARGGGTGLVGGAINSGTIMDMKQMTAISVSQESVSAQAGTPKGLLDENLRKTCRFFGPNPSVGPYCSVGGMIATNASGSRSLKYGSTIDNLLEVTLVDGQGRIITLPKDEEYSGRIASICSRADLGAYPDTSKNSCGYRLDAVRSPSQSHKVVAASEGTLGVIVSAKLRTFPEPEHRSLVVVRYSNYHAMAEDCLSIAGCGPSAIEMVGPDILDGAYRDGWFLFVEFDDADAEPNLSGRIAGQVVDVAADQDAAKWWSMRNASLSRSLHRAGNHPSMVEDAAVPLSRLPRLFEYIEEMGADLGSKIYCYGHAGNANIHLRVASDADGPKAVRYLKRVVDAGGTITGEHGDGMARTRLVKYQYGRNTCLLFAELKRLFDPHNILNPGKVVPHEDVMASPPHK